MISINIKTSDSYLFFHKDHPLEVQGVNSGAEMATLCLAKELVKMGKKMVVCAQIRGAEQVFHGIEFWDLGDDYNLGRAFKRAESLGPFHLISAGRSQPIFQSREVSACLSRMLITHDRSGTDSGIRADILTRIVDKVICVSEAQKEVMVRAGADPSKLVVLYNGVDQEIFKAGDVESRDYNRLVFIGALVEDKGIHWLIQSFFELKKKFPEVILDVYGSPDLWGRAQWFDPGEVERAVPGIKFYGKVSQLEIAKALSTAALCVLPSIWFDPFPLSSLESQACGCPVLTFAVGGLGEGIEDEKTGVVMKEITQARLTQELERLVSHPEILREMSGNCLCISRPKYTWEKVAKGVITLCEEASLESQNI